MKLVNSQNRIKELMSRFVAQVEMGAATSRTDLNNAAETILIPLLNEVYGWSLENINYSEDNQNYPGIDLVDEAAGISVQVTATPGLEKLKHTLEQFVKHSQYLKYNRLIILTLKKKQNSYSETAIHKIVQNRFDFDPQRNIWDYRDILKEIFSFQIDKTLKVQEILEANFGEDGQLIKKVILQDSDSKFGKLNPLPNLPSYLLNRSKELDNLKNLVLSSSSQSSGFTEPASKVGVYGMGGVGKSVLAAMLARDKEIQAAFPGGVFWITLSQEPTLTLRQLDLAKMLGDAHPTLQDVQQGRIHLSQLLEGRTCLLILDDAWKVDHIAAFNVLSEQSKLLFTTRDSSIIKALDAIEHPVDLLNDDEALELLAVCSRQCKESLPVEAHEVVAECGNLPLALSMIGAIAKARPNRWNNLLHKLQNADLDKIRHQFPDYPYPDLLKAIQVSVEALEPEFKIRYLDFAVFPEDVAIPEATLKTFWEPEGLNEYDTQDVIDVLVERSLVRRDEVGKLTLHDLQYDYVKKQIDDLPVLHRQFLNAYSRYCPDGWHTGPHDSYFFENLTYHLNQAELNDELYALLTACPDWMETKFIHCLGDSSYDADLALALRGLVDPLTSRQILVLIRLHAAQLVVDQRVSQYSREDLEALVWLGRETEALSHARLTREPEQRFLKLLTIYDTLQKKNQLNPALLDEIWQTTQYIENNRREPLKTWSLGRVAARLHSSKRFNEAGKVLSLAKETASTLHPSWVYSRAISNPTNRVADSSTESEPKTFVRHWVQVAAFIYLAMAFAECGYHEEVKKALEQAKQITDQIDDAEHPLGSHKTQDHCFEELAVTMSNLGYLEEAKALARLINDGYHASEAWTVLVSALIKAERPQSEIEAAFMAAKEAASQIESVDTQVIRLSELAVALSKGPGLYEKEVENIFAQSLKFVETITPMSRKDDSEWRRTCALSALAKAYARLERFTDAMKIVEKIESTDFQQSVLAKIAISMIETGNPDAGRVMQTIQDSSFSKEVLTKLASALAQTEETERAIEIFNEARKAAFQSSVERGQHSEVEMLYELALALIEVKHFKAAEECIQAIRRDAFRGYLYRADALIKLGLELNKHKHIKRDVLQIYLKAEEEINFIDVGGERVDLYGKLTLGLTLAGYSIEAERTSIEAEKQVPRFQVTIDGGDDTEFLYEARRKQLEQLISKGCFAKALTELNPESFEEFICFLAREASTFEGIEQGLSVKVLRNGLDVALWFRKNWQEIREIVDCVDEDE